MKSSFMVWQLHMLAVTVLRDSFARSAPKVHPCLNTRHAGINSSLPWIMLMVGANCYSQDYSFLEQQLAGKGYLVAVIDELHPVTPDTQAFISRRQ